MHCINCGKSGLFLRVNDAMLCKTCAAEAADAERKVREEEDRQEKARQEAIYNKSKEYYSSLCGAFNIIKDDIYFLNTDNLSTNDLDIKYNACSLLINELPAWRLYPKFKEIFLHDCRRCKDSNYYLENPYLPLTRFPYTEHPNFEYSIPRFIDQLNRFHTHLIVATGQVYKEEEKKRKQEQVKSLNATYKLYLVAGIEYYEKNLMKLATLNPEYSMTKRELIDVFLVEQFVYKYLFDATQVELHPEPDNPHDPNAIKVIVNSQHIGYIGAAYCSHLLPLIKNGHIADISCTIEGGPYKRIVEDYDYDRDKEVYTFIRDENPYYAELQIAEVNPKFDETM